MQGNNSLSPDHLNQHLYLAPVSKSSSDIDPPITTHLVGDALLDDALNEETEDRDECIPRANDPLSQLSVVSTALDHIAMEAQDGLGTLRKELEGNKGELSILGGDVAALAAKVKDIMNKGEPRVLFLLALYRAD